MKKKKKLKQNVTITTFVTLFVSAADGSTRSVTDQTLIKPR